MIQNQKEKEEMSFHTNKQRQEFVLYSELNDNNNLYFQLDKLHNVHYFQVNSLQIQH